MKVDRIALQALQPLQSPFAATAPQPGAGSSFADILSNALGQVEQLQQQAASSAYDLAVGNQADVHTTMIAYEKASLALQLTIEVRNKLVEAFQELMRIQV